MRNLPRFPLLDQFIVALRRPYVKAKDLPPRVAVRQEKHRFRAGGNPRNGLKIAALAKERKNFAKNPISPLDEVTTTVICLIQTTDVII